MFKISKKFRYAYKNADKSSFIVYFVLRTLVLVTLVRHIFLGNWENVFVCILSLILFLAPFFVEKTFKINIPSTLEIIVLCFIFSAEILGEINNFYVTIPHFDTLLHTLNGFLCAGIGFSLVDLLNENSKNFKLSPLFVSIVAFCFSMTIGVLWEFFEYGADNILKTDMQKDRIINVVTSVNFDTENSKPLTIDNIYKTTIYDKTGKELISIDGYLDIGIIDTMKDLIVNFVGAICFSIFGFLYITNRERFNFVKKFIPTKQLKVIKED